MIKDSDVIVFDIDGTLCEEMKPQQTYLDLQPKAKMVAKLKEYKSKGFYIILSTSRNMRSHQGNIGRINATTAKILLEWLEIHDIPFDEIHYAKPWCGHNGFYVDDKSIRPDEFLNYSHEQIIKLLDSKKNV